MNRMKLATVLVAGMVMASHASRAGELVPPAPPNDAASAKFTLGDLWNRLNSGASGTKRGGAFAEPVLGPGTPTMHSTDEIMAAAPTADNVSGATAGDVASGKTFWGLRTSGGTWGAQTGAAYPAPVEKTGQTQCYMWDRETETFVLDAGCATNTPANQDGKLQKGFAWPNPRFTKNGNGTVTDNLTGLIWLANANCFSYQNWVDAMNSAYALASGACGLSDGSTAGQWRLPNVKELESLIDFAYESPALSNTAGTGQWAEGDPFTNVRVLSFYWSSSSTVSVYAPVNAWGVWVGDGSVSKRYQGDTPPAWPVRDGQ